MAIVVKGQSLFGCDIRWFLCLYANQKTLKIEERGVHSETQNINFKNSGLCTYIFSIRKNNSLKNLIFFVGLEIIKFQDAFKFV